MFSIFFRFFSNLGNSWELALAMAKATAKPGLRRGLGLGGGLGRAAVRGGLGSTSFFFLISAPLKKESVKLSVNCISS